MNHVAQVAIRTIERILFDSGEPYSMNLATLSIKSRWSEFFRHHLGKPKVFLLQHPQIFRVLADNGPGNDVVQLVRDDDPQELQQNAAPPQVMPPLIIPTENVSVEDSDLCRNFDNQDEFFNNRARFAIILQNFKRHWSLEFSNTLAGSPLVHFTLEDAMQIYERAYCKCTRLSVFIANVTPDMSRNHLKMQLQEQLKQCGNRSAELFLFKNTNDSGALYSLTYATLWCRGGDEDATLARDRVVDALNAGIIQINGITIRLNHHEIGNSPCLSALRATVQELIFERTRSRLPTPLTDPFFDQEQQLIAQEEEVQQQSSDPSPLNSHGLGTLAVQNNNGEIASLPPAALWPPEHPHCTLHDPVVDPVENRIVAKANERLKSIETRLREECAIQSALDRDDQEDYDSKLGVEWLGSDYNKLGHGAEGRIFAGLYKNPAHKDGEKQLVAVKQNYDGKNLFNSQEREHFINMGTRPGIVKYYCGFKVRASAGKNDILVQDIGCMSLAELITKNGEEEKKADSISDAGSLLQANDRFRLTKAVAMAVQVLHSEKPSVVHRDIRPENVLIMPDGTLCLTDFGLARRNPYSLSGSSHHTMAMLTTMQPYEIQCCFADTQLGDEEKLRVTHAGDIFMLGCVMAFINTGKKPFSSDDKIFNSDKNIADRLDPDLGDRLPQEEPWLTHLLRQMMDHNAERRPTIDMVLRHPYFKTTVENFADTLRSRIECCLVNDFNGVETNKGPVDDENFKAMENVLLPIEAKLVADRDAGEIWYNTLSADIFEGKAKVPFANEARPLAFQGNVDVARTYPLPEVAKLVKWLRNVYIHVHSDISLQDKLRKSRPKQTGNGNGDKGDDAYYLHAGEFYLKHPAVCWFLPMVWEQHLHALQKTAEEQRSMAQRHQEEKSNLDDVCKALDNLFL